MDHMMNFTEQKINLKNKCRGFNKEKSPKRRSNWGEKPGEKVSPQRKKSPNRNKQSPVRSSNFNDNYDEMTDFTIENLKVQAE